MIYFTISFPLIALCPSPHIFVQYQVNSPVLFAVNSNISLSLSPKSGILIPWTDLNKNELLNLPRTVLGKNECFLKTPASLAGVLFCLYL